MILHARKPSTSNDELPSWGAVRKVAREYFERGWKPLAIPTGRKHPQERCWQAIEITSENVEQQFRPWHRNIGVQFGPVSGGLCDVDLD